MIDTCQRYGATTLPVLAGEPRRPYRSSVQSSQEADVTPAGTDARVRVGGDRMGQEFMIDIAKIGGALEIAVIEVGQARLIPVEAPFDRCAGDEDRARGAMVGAV